MFPNTFDHAIRQIVSRAIAPEGVVNLFAAAELKKLDIADGAGRLLRTTSSATVSRRAHFCHGPSPASTTSTYTPRPDERSSNPFHALL